ncbi:helix-turn-helix transcriptional regulator [Streptosporangium lutulentum]|uniref:AraC-like DNA-binding protein n=1 Tax=Streptosporangium lutulentum TaxID=1461250 RepID=A0ABT9QI00_9ACTN|nr:helix-turn-helix transcriptional regulator [Streptosporangium lutulentum]MDP9845943.1 AraC-like DNA-binding protein [Streptosporangium lutulentum]
MYREWAPVPKLAGRVVCVWTQEATSAGTQPVVPDGCVDLIWGPEGPQVAGPDTGPMPVLMSPGDRYAGVRFRPGKVGEVFGVPVDALRDLRVPLSELDVLTELTTETLLETSAVRPDRAGDTRQAPAMTPESIVGAMQRALAVRMRATPEPDPAAAAIAAALRTGRSVGEVAWELGLGERQLHRRSLRSFGYGPKMLQRVVRFQRALRLARLGVTPAEVAVASGYADQAHLANEVRRLAGMSLSRLVGRP